MASQLSELLRGTLSPYVLRIKDLYSSMDAAYAKAAEYYGFRCGGCSESCCEERFYHYTLAEHLYLLEGMGSLYSETVGELLVRAEDTVRLYSFMICMADLKGCSARSTSTASAGFMSTGL